MRCPPGTTPPQHLFTLPFTFSLNLIAYQLWRPCEMLGSPLIDNPIFCDLLKLKLSLSAIRMGTYMYMHTYIYIYTERWECDISPSWQKPACNTFMHISRIFFWHCKWLRLPAINYWISTANNNYSTAPKKLGTGRDSSRGAALVEWSCGTTKSRFHM